MIKDRNTAFLVDVPGGKWSKIDINEIGKRGKITMTQKIQCFTTTDKPQFQKILKYCCAR